MCENPHNRSKPGGMSVNTKWEFVMHHQVRYRQLFLNRDPTLGILGQAQLLDSV